MALLLCLAVSAFADQITLKNGDHLTGTIEKSDGKALVIKTDYAGEVTVKFDAIQSIDSTGDLNVSLSDGKNVVGPVSTSGENVVVATKSSGPVQAPKASITTLRSPAEEAAYQKSLYPGFREGWNSIYASNDLATANPHTTANAIGGGARYDHDVTPRVFGFVNGDFYHDSLQNLDLRSLFGGGLGLHAIKSDATMLDLLAGVNYTHESYSAFFNTSDPPVLVPAVSRSLAGLTLGDEFMHKVGKSTVLTQHLYFYPDLTNTGEYRGTFNLGLVTKINKWLGWQNSFGDIYVSNPPTGKKKNDVLFSTGLNFSFAH
jgi:putative salt-induced outer membrane protein YdiY